MNRPRVVLVIDDNADNRAIFAMILRYGCFHVIEAADGGEGILLADVHSPDLILLDVQLPDMSGIEVAVRLRSRRELAHVPMLAVTAHGNDPEAAAMLVAGCRDVLTKPIEPRELLKHVQRFLPPDEAGPEQLA